MFEKLIIRWNRLSEGRVVIESYFICLLLPFVFYIIPSWLSVSGGKIHRDGLVDYSMGLAAIFLAPILETIFIFVPVLEVCRYFKVHLSWSILGFALFLNFAYAERFFRSSSFISIYDFNDFAIHGDEEEIFLHALVFTIAVHEFYNFTVVMGSPSTYDKFFY